MKSKRNASSSGASCDGVSLCLYLAMIAILASPSLCIKLYGFDFDNIVSTKIYSLNHSTNCDNKIRVSKTIEKGSLIYAEVQPEIKLKFRMYEAAYTVSASKKINVHDDVVFITKKKLKTPKIKKSIYPINEGTCRSIWQNKNFALPGFGNKTFKINKSVIEKILQRASETT